MNPEGLETEKKYDVGSGTVLPALHKITGVGRVGEPSEAVLEAVYFDTDDLALAARRITLRRRTGGADAGWHLKLASEGAGDSVPQRQEIHAPLGQPDVVPDQLLVHLHAYLRGAGVAPAARLKTRRTTHPLYGDDGVHVADFADDTVESESVGSGLKQEWREWELELVRGSAELFPSAEACITAAGARPAAHESKLGRALGEAWPERPDAERGADAGGSAGAGQSAGRKQPDGKSTAKTAPISGVVTAYLAAQIAQLLRSDPAVRLEEPDAVHQMRSATRRLRSALAVYRKLFGNAAVRRLRDELKWLGHILGAPRDAEVTRERVLANVDALPPEQAEAVKERLERELGERFTAGYRRVQEVLVSDRYYRLLDDLEEFRDRPPALPAAAAPATEVAGKRIGRTVRRLRRSAKAARQEKVGPAREAALHQVRKDAKRLRHAAESVIPLHGKRATRLADAAHRQQKILGDHHDSVMARILLGKLARGPQQSEPVSAAYARLLKKEEKAAARTEAKYHKARRKARKLLKRGVA